jgi:hypothetical protein
LSIVAMLSVLMDALADDCGLARRHPAPGEAAAPDRAAMRDRRAPCPPAKGSQLR